MKILLIALAFFTAHLGLTQTSKVGRQCSSIIKLINRYHYEPKPLDDSLSAYLYDAFIEDIDAGGYYLMAADIEQLSKHRFDLDDQIKVSSSGFFDDFADIFKKRLKVVDSLLTYFETYKFDFYKKEHISYDAADYIDYLDNIDQLKDRWRKYLKYEVLEEIFDGDYLNDPIHAPVDSILMFHQDALKEVIRSERFEVNSYLSHPAGYKTYLSTYFLNLLAGYFDPHTTYFSDIEKEQFEAELSKDNMAYGFSLKEDEKGRVAIAGLVPGGAAWMSNAINKDDVILQVRFVNGKPIDVTQLKLEEFILILQEEDDQEIYMVLEKSNGMKEEVHLVKTEIYVDEDVIKSVILVGEKKIGYITLPDFYTNWDEEGGLGCANDVAKNIIKLKKEGIDGLIIDLRNNGGGSVKEAIDLAGIFIDYGPLGIHQDKFKEPVSLKDLNKGAIYTGPLTILVNGGSASASEIFTAAMQDYNRALVVGSQTYGKATGQVIYPVDPNYNATFQNWEQLDASYGYLKVTGSKFFRITNETHQLVGVTPDVVLRDYYELYDYREAGYPNALSADKVDKKVYYTPFPDFPKSQLQSNSKFRLSSNIPYQEMCGVLDTMQAFTDYYDVLQLNVIEYQKNEQIWDKLWDELLTAETSPSKDFTVTNNAFDLEIMKMDEYRSELNKEYLEIVQKDAYISEAYHVLVDYINSK
ncbi:MAG: carboxy terminal-processing peptidase [Crocinitomicaceae bacterium]|nr:hypothetical protein [Crocinitomicaceae bacterium]